MKPAILSQRNRSMAGLALVLLLLSLTGFFDVLNRGFHDFASRWQAEPASFPEDMVLVLIDEQSLAEMRDRRQLRWPWPRDVFAGMIAVLQQAGASRIVVDLTFLEPSDRVELDDLLGSYAAAVDGLVLAAPEGRMPIVWPDWMRQDFPGLHLEERVGNVTYEPDPDGVIRFYHWPGSLAARAYPVDSDKTRPLVTQGHERLLLHWYGGLADLPRDQVLSAARFADLGYGPDGLLAKIHATGVDEYDPVALRSALQQLPALPMGDAVRGKTVFIGTNAASTYDVKAVPVGSLEPGLLVHATAWANACQSAFCNDVFLRNKGLYLLLPSLLLAWILMLWGWERPDLRMLVVVTVSGVLLTLLSSLLLLRMVYLPPAVPAFALVSSCILLGGRHWLQEARRKQDIQAIFGSYVSSSVVDRLLEDPDSLKLGGEKKELTVYFSDLAGFTEMSESMQPEQLVELVNDYLSEMSEFILEERGYIDKYIGDAIMGVFGAPEPLENHALSACRAALKSRDTLLRLNPEMQKKYGLNLHARIGINTGEMIVGNLGSGRKRNYTVIGDAVNLASRLEGANKQFGTTILLGEKTEEQVRGLVLTRPVELLQVKGKQQPVQTHELLALKDGASGEQVEFARVCVEAWQSYRASDFQRALESYARALQIRPDDALSGLYIERCREYLLQPPPDDWIGVFVMKNK